jgi:uncharacterized protein
VGARERIAVVDVIRGVALIGILLVNMAFFSGPVFYDQAAGITRFDTPPDRAAAWLIRFLGEGKVYSLFSILFGLGLTLQMARAEARGVSFVPLYARRMLVLLGIGLLHAFLLWYGDILVAYALLGFPLLLFRKRAPRTLLIWAGALLTVPVALFGLFTLLTAAASGSAEAAAEFQRGIQQAATESAARAELAIERYARGASPG